MKTLCLNDLFLARIFFVKLMIFQIIFIIGSATIRNVAGCVGVPDSCPKDRIDFRLYTNQKGLSSYHSFDLENRTTISEANFIPGAPIKFIIHGYSGSAGNPLMQKLISEYLKTPEPINVVMVNYENVAKEGCYPRLFWNRISLGKCGAEMIEEIIDKKNIDIGKFHIVGFSIGAQIAAEISHHLETKSSKLKLKRITGLDPAFMFYFFPFVRRLNKKHAKFVDVIHTNAFWFGIPYSGGHYDFYANGGRIQPGCEAEENVSKCYHKAAVEYFILTINRKKAYKARKIACSIWRWFSPLGCPKTSNVYANVGEHAFKPTTDEEGAYSFYT